MINLPCGTLNSTCSMLYNYDIMLMIMHVLIWLYVSINMHINGGSPSHLLMFMNLFKDLYVVSHKLEYIGYILEYIPSSAQQQPIYCKEHGKCSFTKYCIPNTIIRNTGNAPVPNIAFQILLIRDMVHTSVNIVNSYSIN